MTASRRNFLEATVAGMATLSLQACGDGDSGSGSGPGFGGGCGATDIAGNHGHTLNVPTADLTSATAKTYGIQGSADHTHQVTFSPAQLADLKNGNSVIVTSTAGVNSGGSHTHVVTAHC